MRTSGLSLTGPGHALLNAPVADTLAAVERRCAERPEALAVSCGGARISYLELERRSSRLAAYLSALGVGIETPVALLLERSADFVAAALAVWKAGGAYVPLDSNCVAHRAEAILSDSGAAVLLTHRGKAAAIPAGRWRVVDLDADVPAALGSQAGVPEIAAAPDRLAYVIYTSGSTGQPKGVEVTHGSLWNLVEWHQGAFGIGPDDRASQLSSLGFDAAVWEIWPYLSAGASLHMAGELERKSPPELRDWMVEERISIGFASTAVAECLIAMQWPSKAALRLLLTGADTLHRRPPSWLPFVLVNNYGPTECTVVSTSGTVEPLGCERPSIGKPIANCRIHIVDENLRTVALGEAGEICVAGAGVARGYRNLPELTREKFVPDPLDAERGRLYRTGDRGRVLPNGEIEFLGRIDDQIKIRGFRIELDEVTWALNQHPAVRSSAVVAGGGSEDRHLVAYVVVSGGDAPPAAALREFLAARLPDYMIPRVFVRMDGIPLNANGKCDKSALPAPEAGNTLASGQVEPLAAAASPLEQELAALIASQLGVPSVGRGDNFFLMGGHSMFAARLTAKLRDAYGVNMNLRQLFQSPSIAALAPQIERLLRKG